ncbi:superoxide dismutase [Candidatus Kaiserbacteria bacterium]|nr:superoxide dismutase [Candidatus Kaiserbacteria bacterium]
MEYKEQQFNLSTLKGISEKQIEIHLGLYKGYVKHVNLVREKIAELELEDKEKHAYAITELRRRFSFEFDGMRMHEYYFEGLENGAQEISDGELKKALAGKYGSFEDFISHFKTVGMSRGIGWTVLYFDPKGKTLHVTWVGDHELGVLAGLPILIALDMWEHAFMVDYTPAEKGTYIDAFISNINWGVIEKRLAE